MGKLRSFILNQFGISGPDYSNFINEIQAIPNVTAVVKLTGDKEISLHIIVSNSTKDIRKQIFSIARSLIEENLFKHVIGFEVILADDDNQAKDILATYYKDNVILYNAFKATTPK